MRREYGVVTPADPEEAPVEFEVKGGRLVKPKGFGAGQFETSELAFPLLRRILFRTVEPGSTQIGRVTPTYRDVFEAVWSISRMKFYRLFPDAMRDPRKPTDTSLLNERGSNLASVLRKMLKSKSPYLDEIKNALEHVVPGMSDLQVRHVGGFLVVKLRHQGANGGSARSSFDLSQESDGTVRLLGLLTALYQDSPPSLIGIEEPELTIHPGALAVISDILVEAAQRTQVLVTTHSPDLIDRLPIDSLRAVDLEDGCTRVGRVSDTQAEAVRTGLFTSGELHSMEGLVPRT